MKGKILAALIALLVVGFLPHQARAQIAPSFLYPQYTISVGSTSTPACVIPYTAGPKATWGINLRAAGTNPILCWAYFTSSCPAAVPSTCVNGGSGATGCWEVTNTKPWADFSNYYASASNPSYQTALTAGIACVLETGSAELADGWYR